jgi:type III restriction enzyme
MKFQFKIQPFQTEAAESVVRVFAGQPNVGASKYRRDIGSEKKLTEDERLKRRGYMALSYSALSEDENGRSRKNTNPPTATRTYSFPERNC